MDFKFSKETTDGGTPARTQEKGKQTGLLVLLLVLLAGFSYLYFFTGLIRPKEQHSPPPPPSPPQQVVKQALPSRDAAAPVSPAPAVPDSRTQPKPADTKAAPVPAVKPVEKAAEPVKTVAKQEPVKPVAVPAAKKVEPVKPAVAAAAAKTDTKKAALPARAEESKVSADTKKPAEPAKKPVVAKTQGPWTLVVGLYVVEETLAEDMSKVKKAGFTPVMTSGPKRPVTMNRLFYGEYAGKEEAQQAVAHLRRAAGGGFSLQRGDKYEVYAGSYAVLSGAQSEQQRLSAAGVKVTIKKTQVPLASRKLTAGTFTDRAAAAEALKKLKAAGLGTPVLE